MNQNPGQVHERDVTETLKERGTGAQAFGFLSTFSSGGLLLTTQLLTVGLALLKGDFAATEWLLLIASLAAVITTILLLRHLRSIQR